MAKTRDAGAPKPGAASRRKPLPAKPEDAQTAFASLLTPAQATRDYIQVAITLPRSHMRVLTTEANLFGLRRSQFLELLLLNQMGQKVLTRLPGAPTYEFTREELTETERFLWVMRPDVKKAFEAHILPSGFRPSAWVISALNEWAALTR
jgi:hypothetical protein